MRTGKIVLVDPSVVCLLLVDFYRAHRVAPHRRCSPSNLHDRERPRFSFVLVLYGAFLIGYMKTGRLSSSNTTRIHHSEPSRRIESGPQLIMARRTNP